MADKKTSQEVSGAPIQKDDLHRIARSGSNYKLTSEEIFSETITLTNLYSLIASYELIAGRYYTVTEALGNSVDTIIVKAISTSEVDLSNFRFDVTSASPTGVAYGSNNDLSVFPYTATDMYGNLYIAPYGGSIFPDYNNNVFQGNVYNGVYGSLTLINWNTAIEIFNNNFSNGNYDISNSQYRDCTFNLSNIINTTGVSTAVDGCNFFRSIIDINQYGDENILITNSNFENSTLILNPANGALNIENCTFKNCIVEIKNNATVKELTIIGTKDSDGNLPTYVIDGAYQNNVFNNWGGTVVSGINGNGYSTVRAKLEYCQFCGSNGTFDEFGVAYLIPNSPIGIYEFDNIQGMFSQIIGFSSILNPFEHLNHKIKLKYLNNSGDNTIVLPLVNSTGSLTTSGEIVKYHGITAKVGQLFSKNNYMEIFAAYEPYNYQDIVWFAIYGTHYDN